MKINYTVKGSGQAVILLHGWSGSISSLTPLQDDLAEKGFQVFNLDLPGFGKSEMLKPQMELADFVAFLLNFMDRLNLINPVLVGHSFGGKIAAAFAAKHGSKISRLILIDASGINPGIDDKKKSLRKQAKSFGQFFDLPILRMIKPLARKVFYKAIVRESDYLLAGKMKETFKLVVNQHLDQELPKIENNTLIIWGEKDSITPLWQGKAYAVGIKNSRLEVIEGARHGLPLTMPELVAKIIYLYLSK